MAGQAVATGRIRGAVLDVYDGEPAGRGRRAGGYGAVLLAAYDADADADVFRAVTKCGAGFSDAEIAVLNGGIAAEGRRKDARRTPEGRRAGVATPLHDCLTALVRGLEESWDG